MDTTSYCQGHLEGAIPYSNSHDMSSALSAVRDSGEPYVHFNLGLTEEDLAVLSELRVSFKEPEEIKESANSRQSINTELCIDNEIQTFLEEIGNSAELAKAVLSIACALKLQYIKAMILSQPNIDIISSYDVSVTVIAAVIGMKCYAWHTDITDYDFSRFNLPKDMPLEALFMPLKGAGTAFRNSTAKFFAVGMRGGQECEAPTSTPYEHTAFGSGTLLSLSRAVHASPVGPHDGGRIFLRFSLTPIALSSRP